MKEEFKQKSRLSDDMLRELINSRETLNNMTAYCCSEFIGGFVNISPELKNRYNINNDYELIVWHCLEEYFKQKNSNRND